MKEFPVSAAVLSIRNSSNRHPGRGSVPQQHRRAIEFTRLKLSVPDLLMADALLRTVTAMLCFPIQMTLRKDKRRN